jgi:hypothetical protein
MTSRRVAKFCRDLGGVYGAVVGAAYLGLMALSFGNDLGSVVLYAGMVAGAALLGALGGALGGAVAGLAAARLRHPIAWALAGAAGGALPGALFGVLTGQRGVYEWQHLFNLSVVLLPALVGGAVGAAVGCGLHRGTSPLPLVTEVAAALQAAEREQALRLRTAAEVSPSDAPAGRGDEPSATAGPASLVGPA